MKKQDAKLKRQAKKALSDLRSSVKKGNQSVSVQSVVILSLAINLESDKLDSIIAQLEGMESLELQFFTLYVVEVSQRENSTEKLQQLLLDIERIRERAQKQFQNLKKNMRKTVQVCF